MAIIRTPEFLAHLTSPVELCESKDHDGMDCLLLHDGGEGEHTVKVSLAIEKDKAKEWCADCEEYGHGVENCPNSQDVF
ncbi:hypothetical protein FRC11_011754 [Ceratobasidium sp. 423]|nr:hypothetical protein FRC11_011754 [Ceratobasidium sp. 423]